VSSVTADIESVTGRRPRSFREFARDAFRPRGIRRRSARPRVSATGLASSFQSRSNSGSALADWIETVTLWTIYGLDRLPVNAASDGGRTRHDRGDDPQGPR